ncbi:MAG: hypothetical protein ACFE91_07170 [Promethearchaeota archaeon]
MSKYIIFFESEIISSSDIYFNPFQRKSVIANKVYCSFLKKGRDGLDVDLQKSLAREFPDCKVIEFGKIVLTIERQFTIFYIIFSTKKDLMDDINGNFYSPQKLEELKKITQRIVNNLSKSLNILVVKRLLSNIFLPDKLKDKFRRTIEKSKEKELHRNNGEFKSYYQNYMRFPVLTEFQTNLILNFDEEFNKTLKKYYLILSSSIKDMGTLFAYEFNFYELKSYSLEKFERREVANIISSSFLEYLFSLYVRIIDNLTIYRKRIELFSRNLKTFPGKVLIELKEQVDELQRNLFEEYPLIYISVLDRLILYEEDEENPDLTDQIFGARTSHISLFRRQLQLLDDKIKNFQSEIKTLLLYKHDKITSFTKEQLVKKLNSIKNEKDFRNTILIPILKDLGYNNIQDTHGQHEYGVDILFSNQNRFNLMEWNAVVAKIGDINLEIGTELSQNLKKVFTQIYQAKSMNHLEKNYGNVKINRVFIVTNGKINYHAKNVLSQKDPLIEGNIFFIDYDVLLNLF